MVNRRIHVSAGNGGPDTGRLQGRGNNHPTDRFAVKGTDLGYLFSGGGGTWVGGLFGDTFNKPDPRGPVPPGGDLWRSPVMGRTTNRDFLTRGIVWDSFVGTDESGGVAREVFPYRHIGDRGRLRSGSADAFTIIPDDAVELPDGTYLACGFRVRDWVTGATQAMCRTVGNMWFRSTDRDASTWSPAEVTGRAAGRGGIALEWGPEDRRGRYFQNASLVMVPGDDHLYVFGSREGRKTGTGSEADGVCLRRAPWQRCLDPGAWEYRGFSRGRWRWGRRVRPTPLFGPVTPGGHIGELNVRYIAGRLVLSYVDATLGAVSLTAEHPDAPWSGPTVTVARHRSPALYAPSVHPWTTDPENTYLHLSSWLSVPDMETGEPVTVNYCTEGWEVSVVSDTGAPGTPGTPGPDTSSLSPEERDRTVRRILAASAEANPDTAPLPVPEQP